MLSLGKLRQAVCAEAAKLLAFEAHSAGQLAGEALRARSTCLVQGVHDHWKATK